ncbi:aminophospholipid transporter, putative [Plasmodium ovale]|uniref:Aminophospholipid transporter, putative n=1 Tax=Plasmodium ovale TaxID=36330 RepID=A0A1D3TKV3_PLAOA|nr:aminophospholipid transporter, putative [Plasmodium ovale]
MKYTVKELAPNMEKNLRRDESRIAKRLRRVVLSMKDNIFNIKKCFQSKRRTSLLYYNYDEYANYNGNNIYVTVFISPILDFIFDKVKNTFNIVSKWISLFFIWSKTINKIKNKSILKGVYKNKTSKKNIYRCIFLDIPKGKIGSLSHKHIKEICKNYLTNTLHYLHNLEYNNGTRNFKKCKKIRKIKKAFISKITNLKAFNAENNLYISDESLVKKIMCITKSEQPDFTNRKEMKEKKNMQKINMYDRLFVKTCHIKGEKNEKNNRGRNNRQICSHYRSKYHLIGQVSLHKLKNIHFILLLICALLQHFPTIRSNHYVYVSFSFYLLLICSILKDVHSVVQTVRRERYIAHRKYRRVTHVGLVEVAHSDIKVGDILYLEENEECPADLILLKSSSNAETVFACSKHLDGDTDLKMKKCIQLTNYLPSIYDIFQLRIKVLIEKPHKCFNRMNGYIIFLNVTEFAQSVYNDLMQLQNVFYINGTNENEHYNEVFNYLIEDTYIERTYACMDFLIKKSMRVLHSSGGSDGACRGSEWSDDGENCHEGFCYGSSSLLTNRTTEADAYYPKGDVSYDKYVKKLYSGNIGKSRNKEEFVKYEENIGVENMLWSNSTIVKGNVYGLVAYAGGEKKGNIIICKKKNMSMFEKDVKCKTKILLILCLCFCSFLCLKGIYAFRKDINILTFLRYFLVCLSFIPFIDNMYIYIFGRMCLCKLKRCKVIENCTIFNYNIVKEFSNTSFLLCGKTGTITKNNLGLKKFYFLFDKFSLEGEKNGKSFFTTFFKIIDFNLCLTLHNSSDLKDHILTKKGKFSNFNLNVKSKKMYNSYNDVFRRILNYTSYEIKNIFLTFLCIIFCNSSISTKKIDEQFFSQQYEKNCSSFCSTNCEDNLLMHFLHCIGIRILHKDFLKLVFAIRISDGGHMHRGKVKNEHTDTHTFTHERGKKKYMYFKNSLQKDNVFRMSSLAERVDRGEFKGGRFGGSSYSGGSCSNEESGSRGVSERRGGLDYLGECSHAKGSHASEATIYHFDILEHAQFDKRRKVMRTVVSYCGRIFMFAKGYDANVIDMLGSRESRRRVKRMWKSLSKKGFRLLLFAYKEISPSEYKIARKMGEDTTLHGENHFNHMDILAIVTFREEIREKAKECLDVFKRANIKTWILSGDKKENVFSAANCLRLINENNMICHLSKRKLIQLLYNMGVAIPSASSTNFLYGMNSNLCYALEGSYDENNEFIRRNKSSVIKTFGKCAHHDDSCCIVKHSQRGDKFASIRSSSFNGRTASSPFLPIRGNHHPSSIHANCCIVSNSDQSSLDQGECPHIVQNEGRQELSPLEVKAQCSYGGAVHIWGACYPPNAAAEIHKSKRATPGDTYTSDDDDKVGEALRVMLCDFGGVVAREKRNEDEYVPATKEEGIKVEENGSITIEGSEHITVASGKNAQNVVYIVKGDVVEYYLKHEREQFMRALQNSPCVLFYRCNSVEKGKVARCLRESTTSSICSVGCNMKDVNMLNESNISITINNSRRDVCNLYADMKVASFDDLARLFFLYGHNVYINFNSFVKGMYYRGSSFLFLQFYFSYLFNSDVSMFSSAFLLSYFVTFPIIIITTFWLSQNSCIKSHPTKKNMQHISMLRKNATFYKHLNKKAFSLKGFYKVLLVSFFQTSLIYFFSYYNHLFFDVNYEVYALTVLFIMHLLQSLFSLNTSILNVSIVILSHIFIFLFHFVILITLKNFQFVHFHVNVDSILNIILASTIANIPFIIYKLYKKCTGGKTPLSGCMHSFEGISSKNDKIFHIGSLNLSLSNIRLDATKENIFTKYFRVFLKRKKG